MTNAINLRISSTTLTSTLTLYDTSAVINTKLSNTMKYDTVRSDSLNKVVNLTGLSSLSFDTYDISDGVYKKDLLYDISNSGSYTRNTLFSKYLRSNNLWVEGNLRMNPGFLYLYNPVNVSTITTTNLSYLANSTSNLQTQIDSLSTIKAPINNPTFTGTVSGITKSMVGLGNVDNTTDLNKPISTATQNALDSKNDLFQVAIRCFGTGGVQQSYGANNIITSNVDTSGGAGTYKITMPSHSLGSAYGVIVTPNNGNSFLC